jgi:hypothetical protein
MMLDSFTFILARVNQITNNWYLNASLEIINVEGEGEGRRNVLGFN